MSSRESEAFIGKTNKLQSKCISASRVKNLNLVTRYAFIQEMSNQLLENYVLIQKHSRTKNVYFFRSSR